MSERRRVATIGIAAVLALSAGCGGDDDAADDTAETAGTGSAGAATTAAGDTADGTAQTSAPDATGGTAQASGDAPKMAIVYSAEWLDGSWGQAAYDAANKMLEDGTISDLSLQENVAPGAEGERAMRALAEDGFNPIIAHSFNFGEDIKKIAGDYPETLFVYAGGFGDVAENMSDYAQPFYQASYLQGMLAAGVMREGRIAGAAGFDIPVCQAMYQAFLQGAQEINPGIDGSFVAVGDWYDVQLAKEAALGQADAGATMYIGCGQAPTFGQIEAAKERGGVATGYVGDMSELGDVVLSSVVWNLEATFDLMVADVVAGEVNPARYYDVPLAEGGMSIVINPAREDEIPAEVVTQYEETLAAIESGEFEVPFVGEGG